MFQAVIQRAQHAVDKTIDQAINRTVVVVPFVIAAGFATAALAYRLNYEFGPELGNLLMGALFAVIGFVTMALMHARPQPAVETDAEPDTVAADSVEMPAAETKGLGGADRDLVLAALQSAAPLAFPELLRLAMKNIPLLAVLAGAVFVATRPIDQADPSTGGSAEAASA